MKNKTKNIIFIFLITTLTATSYFSAIAMEKTTQKQLIDLGKKAGNYLCQSAEHTKEILLFNKAITIGTLSASTLFCIASEYIPNPTTYIIVKGISLLYTLGCSLIIHGEFVENALHKAARTANISLMQHYLNKRKISIDQKNSLNQTALMHACATGNLGSTRFLLDQNANLNEQDYEGNTAMHLCARNTTLTPQQKNPILTLLAQNGARLDLTNNSRSTPLDYITNTELKKQLKNPYKQEKLTFGQKNSSNKR